MLGRGAPARNRVSWLAFELTGSDLRRADLTQADLCRVRLVDCPLNRSDLGGADLRNDDFTGVDLRGAVANSFTIWPPGFDWRGAGVTEITDAASR